MANILAIDQGTSSTKALVVSDEGKVLGESSEPVHPKAGGRGAVEQDPEELLQSIVDAGRGALAAAGVPVEAVGIGNQGETVLRWDRKTGRSYGPALSWQDRRAVTVTRELEGQADRLTELTGLPLDPYFAGPKMMWLRRESGDEGVITMIDAWTLQQLAGAFVTDAATASRALLLDLESATWSEEACAIFGIDPASQPEIVDCDATIGETAAFGDALPITGLAVDQQAALFAESCFAPGEAKCTYGTGAFILATAGERAPQSKSRLAACVAWRLDGTTTYCYTHDYVSGTWNWGVGKPNRFPDKQGGSWAYALLPYLDATLMYEDREWRQAFILYVCPSRRVAQALAPQNDARGTYCGGGWPWGKTDYAANALLVPNRPQACRGLNSIRDGFSNTVLILPALFRVGMSRIKKIDIYFPSCADIE